MILKPWPAAGHLDTAKFLCRASNLSEQELNQLVEQRHSVLGNGPKKPQTGLYQKWMFSQKDCIATKKSLSWSYHTPTKWNANRVLTTNFHAFALNKFKAYVEFLWENIHWYLYVSCHQGVELSFVKVRRVMLKHRRGAKCPLLVKFLSSWVEQSPGNFVSMAEIFEAYESAVRLWTDDDSVGGQTQFLMKRNRVSILQRSLL